MIHDVGVIVVTMKPKFYTVNALIWLDFSNLVDVGVVVPAAGERVNLNKIYPMPLKAPRFELSRFDSQRPSNCCYN